MCFRIGNEKLLEKHKTIWTNIEGLRNIKLNALPVYDDKYIKTQVRTYGDKLYTNFCGLNLLDDGAEYESFTIISIDSLLVYENKYYFQVYLDNCTYKIMDRQITDHLDDSLFKTDKDLFLILINGSYKFCNMKELI